MLESENQQTTEMVPTFLEKPIDGDQPSRCVDGRGSSESEQGPQMLGGSSHPILLEAIFNDKDFDQKVVTEGIETLQKSGIKTGAHRGTHRHGELSDCGFADKMPEILQTAIQKRELISNRLQTVYRANSDKFKPLNLPPIEGLVNEAYEKIAAYDPSKIKLKGNALVTQIENADSAVETVEGNHAEQVAFVNIRPDTTLDTSKLNQRGQQGFNLDLLQAADHAQKLGVPQNFSIPASLILYQATEIVVVEDKGKSPPPVEIHS